MLFLSRWMFFNAFLFSRRSLSIIFLGAWSIKMSSLLIEYFIILILFHSAELWFYLNWIVIELLVINIKTIFCSNHFFFNLTTLTLVYCFSCVKMFSCFWFNDNFVSFCHSFFIFTWLNSIITSSCFSVIFMINLRLLLHLW